MSEYIIPKKVKATLARLQRSYAKKGDTAHIAEILKGGYVTVRECIYSYSGYGNEVYCHDIQIYLPTKTIDQIDILEEPELKKVIKDDFNRLFDGVAEEEISEIHIFEIDETDDDFKSAMPILDQPQLSARDVGIWQDEMLRVFISHRDDHKEVANQLAESLSSFGMSCFVAHDTIQPMAEWQKTILNGLQTMEVMLVLLTDDFHESTWTNQEIGFAMGKNIPILTIKVGLKDPAGFLSALQATKAVYQNIYQSVNHIVQLLHEKVESTDRLKDIQIEQFVNSKNFMEAIENLHKLKVSMKALSDKHLTRIVEGYYSNDQLHHCGGIDTSSHNLISYLQSATNKRLSREGRQIKILD